MGRRAMRRLGWAMLAAALPLLCACQAPGMPVPTAGAEPAAGAQVALTREAMRSAAEQADGPSSAEPSIRAVGAWRGAADEAEE